MQEDAIATVDPFFVLPAVTLEIRPGRRLSVSIAVGQGEAALTIFLVHGAGGNKNHWRFQWQALTAAGYRVVAWDAMGHGASPQPAASSAYAGSALIEDYWAIFEAYGTARNILIAHSYGTRLTLCILERLARMGRLGRVAGVMLLGPPAPRLALGGGPMKWIPSFVLELMRPRLSRAFRAAAWHPDTDPALMDYEEAATRGNSLLMMKSLILQSAQPDPAGFAALTLPVEVIAGDADRLTPVASAEALVQALPNATLHVIDRAGHQMMLEQPADTNRLIFEVIGRAAPG